MSICRIKICTRIHVASCCAKCRVWLLRLLHAAYIKNHFMFSNLFITFVFSTSSTTLTSSVLALSTLSGLSLDDVAGGGAMAGGGMYSMSMEPLQMLCPSPLLQLHVLSLLLLLLVFWQRGLALSDIHALGGLLVHQRRGLRVLFVQASVPLVFLSTYLDYLDFV